MTIRQVFDLMLARWRSEPTKSRRDFSQSESELVATVEKLISVIGLSKLLSYKRISFKKVGENKNYDILG